MKQVKRLFIAEISRCGDCPDYRRLKEDVQMDWCLPKKREITSKNEFGEHVFPKWCPLKEVT